MKTQNNLTGALVVVALVLSIVAIALTLNSTITGKAITGQNSTTGNIYYKGGNVGLGLEVGEVPKWDFTVDINDNGKQFGGMGIVGNSTQVKDLNFDDADKIRWFLSLRKTDGNDVNYDSPNGARFELRYKNLSDSSAKDIPYMSVGQDGKVAIGKGYRTPAWDLTVNIENQNRIWGGTGIIGRGDQMKDFNFEDNTNKERWFLSYRKSDIDSSGVLQGGNFDIRFNSNVTTKSGVKDVAHLSITREGKIGIGNTDPKAKLDVAGSIKLAYDNVVCNWNTLGTLRMGTGSNPSIGLYICSKDSGTPAWMKVTLTPSS